MIVMIVINDNDDYYDGYDDCGYNVVVVIYGSILVSS